MSGVFRPDRDQLKGDERCDESRPLLGDGTTFALSEDSGAHSLFTCMRARSITLRTSLWKTQRMCIASKHCTETKVNTSLYRFRA